MLRQQASTAVLLLLVTGCAWLGLAEPQTFNARILVGIETVATIRNVAADLLIAGKLTPDDAQNVQDQASIARYGLDVAQQIEPVDPEAAEAKLEAVSTILKALQAYLGAKQ